MQVSDLKTRINQDLAGELMSLKMMLSHINWAIDNINSELNACFPILKDTDTEYTAIPDKYIRSVIVPGAVHHYYMVDDEGATGEQDFNQMFQNGLFIMLRDYSHLIPARYQDDGENGSVESTYEDVNGLRGIEGYITTVGWW